MNLLKRVDKPEVLDLILKGSIQLGTLSKYKTTEDAQRVDDCEGQRPIYFNAKAGDKLSKDSFNTLSGHIGSGIKINDPKLKFNFKHDSKFIFESNVNIFIYCISNSSEDDEYLNQKYGNYKIRIKDIKLFKFLIANKLEEEIIKNQKIKLNWPANTISYGHHEILYLEKSPIDSSGIKHFNKKPLLI